MDAEERAGGDELLLCAERECGRESECARPRDTASVCRVSPAAAAGAAGTGRCGGVAGGKCEWGDAVGGGEAGEVTRVAQHGLSWAWGDDTGWFAGLRRAQDAAGKGGLEHTRFSPSGISSRMTPVNQSAPGKSTD